MEYFKFNAQALTPQGLLYTTEIVTTKSLRDEILKIKDQYPTENICFDCIEGSYLHYTEAGATGIETYVLPSNTSAATEIHALGTYLTSKILIAKDTQLSSATYEEYNKFNIQCLYFPLAIARYNKGYDLEEIRTLVYIEMLQRLTATENHGKIVKLGVRNVANAIQYLVDDALAFKFPPGYPLD